MADPRAGLKAAIKDSLTKVYELEATVAEFRGDQSLLEGRLNGLLASLGALHAKSDEAEFDIPTDLIKYVDEGGNPDAFFGGATRSALRDNQAAKGKATSLESFREALLQQAGEAFPEDAAAYLAATGTPGQPSQAAALPGSQAESGAAAAAATQPAGQQP